MRLNCSIYINPWTIFFFFYPIWSRKPCEEGIESWFFFEKSNHACRMYVCFILLHLRVDRTRLIVAPAHTVSPWSFDRGISHYVHVCRIKSHDSNRMLTTANTPEFVSFCLLRKIYSVVFVSLIGRLFCLSTVWARISSVRLESSTLGVASAFARPSFVRTTTLAPPLHHYAFFLFLIAKLRTGHCWVPTRDSIAVATCDDSEISRVGPWLADAGSSGHFAR